MIIKVRFPQQALYWASNIIERVKSLKLAKDAYDEEKSFSCNNDGSEWYAEASNAKELKELIEGEILNDVFTYCSGVSVWDIKMPTFEVA